MKASNPDFDDYFGHSVALSSDGNTLAVGAIREDSNGTGVNSGAQANNSAPASGAVYLY
ncbi:FG-GAP repeat protein [Vibrio sp. 10N.261.45.A1]|uniref:FG-GAP repeat protein n=1 Tax=Vibrio sp. 10N.261.45.A1 TaxID=1880841 RepID=UPI001F53B4CD|nr:FG-GAP repeat protein [Vibrio sp. 10N.261.45.A1]